MKIEVTKEKDLIILKPVTENLFRDNSSHFKAIFSDYIINKGYKYLILNLSCIKYCDSSGLSSILLADHICKLEKGIFIITNLNPKVKNILSLNKSDYFLKIVSTVSKARKLLTNLKQRPESIVLYFQAEDFSESEMTDIIFGINQLYQRIGGDEIIINGLNLLTEKRVSEPINIV